MRRLLLGVTNGCLMAYLIGLMACAPLGMQVHEASVIPLPTEMEVGKGVFKVDSLQWLKGETDTRVSYLVDSTLSVELGEEGYDLSVSPDAIEVNAATETGVFYAKQTLRQLLTNKGILCVKIKDTPRFKYRGLHVDVSRHFFSKNEMMKLLDEMAYYKLNKFHFHLTDNGGWRIQIDKYPKLTSMGAFRTQCEWIEWWDKKDRTYLPEGSPNAYGGYYTKNDIREIVAYAEKLHIEVIPEIEFPAHSDEVFVGYPELCCMGKTYSSGEFCAGNERTYTFMEDVLTEIIDLFPSKYIHIGGDEARKIAWKTCPKCQSLMKKNQLKDLDDLQCYMIHRIESFLTSKGKVMMGWDEILKNHLKPSSTILSYRGQQTTISAANMGYDVIFTPGAALYFDWYQATPDTQPRAMIGYSPIKKVYSMCPIPTDSLTALRNEEMIQGKPADSLQSVDWIRNTEATKHIIGVQGCAWSEFINDEKQLEYMIFPRILAVAEMAWTPENKRNWLNFKPRMNAHVAQLLSRGVNAFTLTDEIEVTTRFTSVKGEIEVTLDTEKYPAEVHYTLDGKNPTLESSVYKHPFIVKGSVMLKAAIFRGGVMKTPLLEKAISPYIELRNYFEYVEPEHWKNINL